MRSSKQILNVVTFLNHRAAFLLENPPGFLLTVVYIWSEVARARDRVRFSKEILLESREREISAEDFARVRASARIRAPRPSGEQRSHTRRSSVTR